MEYKYDETDEDAKVLASLCTKSGDVASREASLSIAKKSTNITFLHALANDVNAKVTTGEVGSEAARGFCDEIFSNLISSIRRCCPFIDGNRNTESFREGNNSDSISWEQVRGRYKRMRTFTAQKFAALVETCESVKSSRSVSRLLGILTDISRKPEKIAFSNFLFPALAMLPPGQVNGNIEFYMNLFRSVISSYTKYFVPTLAQKIQDWSSPKRGCPSGCGDCRSLDRFLTAIDQAETKFAVVTARRKHLEQRLLNSGLEVSTDTRSGSPYKLVVKKTRSIWRDDVESLQKARHTAKNEIFAIGKTKLWDLLGEKQYQKLHTALDIPYTPANQVLGSIGQSRASIANVPPTAANKQENKRGHGQAFDENVDPSKRVK